ncbi:MAG: nitronate monooxygenase [Chloroflexota bacterium]|nr:nitronate monooxygenase [Chloroflexota bacterium]
MNRICQLAGIKYPIFQGSMAWVAFPPLVAAVSNAGGLVILTGSIYTTDDMDKQIRAVRELTGKPFGVNFTPTAPNIQEVLDVCLQEKVSLVTYGRGDAAMITARLRPQGVLSFPVVPTVRAAVKAEKDGADGVIVSGYEAGGHVGRIGSLALVPQAVDRVSIPVVAAGGFGDARGLAAALALGAEGVQMGTRFICTQECSAPLNIKMRFLRATEEDTLVTGHITGIRCRVLKNKLSEVFDDLEDRQAPQSEFDRAGLGKIRQAFVEGDEEMGSLCGGQVVGMLHDIPTCQELIERIAQGAQQVLAGALARASF